MSARGQMIHRATVQRDQQAADDAWGQPQAPDWQNHIVSQPCRAWFNAGKEVADGDKTAVLEDSRVTMPLGTDVTEKDRISVIKHKNGEVLFTGPFDIDKIGRRRDHLAVFVSEVSS